MNKNSIELWLVRHGETIFNKKISFKAGQIHLLQMTEF